MTAISCEQAEELLGAYALDALSATELSDVEAHLKTCAEHRHAVRELRQTVSLLALAVEEREPSAELRDRIIRSIRSASSENLPETAIAPQPGPVVVPIRRAPRLPRWAPRPAFAAMAAAILLALGAGTFAGYRLSQNNSETVAYRFSGSGQAPAAQASLVYLRHRHQAVVAVKGLPALAPGRVYEMWLVDKNGLPVAEGVTTAPDGRIAAQMDADLSRYKQFAITIESGERSSPTTAPVLQGSLEGGSA